MMNLVPPFNWIRLQALDDEDDCEFEGLEEDAKPAGNDARLHGEFAELSSFTRKRNAEVRGQAHLLALVQKPGRKGNRRNHRDLLVHFSCPAPASEGTVQDVVEVKLALRRPVELREVIVAGLLLRAKDFNVAKDRRDAAEHLALWIRGQVLSFDDAERLLERALFGYKARPSRGPSKQLKVADLRIDEEVRTRTQHFTSIRLSCGSDVAQARGQHSELKVNQVLAAWILRPGNAGNPVHLQAIWGEDTPVWVEFPLPHPSEVHRVSLSDILQDWLHRRRLSYGLSKTHKEALAWLQGQLAGNPTPKPVVHLPANPSRRCPTCRQTVRLRMASVFGHDVLELGPHPPAAGPARYDLCLQVDAIAADFDPVAPWLPNQTRPRPLDGRAALRRAFTAQAAQNLPASAAEGLDAP